MSMPPRANEPAKPSSFPEAISEAPSQAASGVTSGTTLRDPAKPPAILLPGMAGIALYMLVLSAVVAFGVIGRRYPAFLLLFSVAAAVASFGILRLKRWGWALTLAATFLLMTYQFYLLARIREAPAGVMGALNLILFLYLVRPEVRSRLK